MSATAILAFAALTAVAIVVLSLLVAWRLVASKAER